MKIKKIIGIAAIVVLCGIAVFSGVVFHHQYQDQKNSAQQFEDLSNMIADVDKSELDKEPVPEPGEDAPVSETISEEELAEREAELAMEKYRALFDQNSDFVGWMTDEKKQRLKDIFWEMNEISYETEEKTETVIVETDDGEGNIVEEEVEETTVYLYITVSHKTVDEMMAQYGFTEDQKAQVAELLAQDSSMWASVLYGIYGADDQIVAVALSQLGNVGGEPYWSWYGFGSRVEWCACFVSWCADQCGYIETGVIPKYAGCVNGVNWFKDRGQWADNDIEPAPGMIIFFDWDNKGSSGPQDGESDHTGIVERVEDGIVYTVEGNSGDSCRENHYAVGYYEILGYGIPAY